MPHTLLSSAGLWPRIAFHNLYMVIADYFFYGNNSDNSIIGSSATIGQLLLARSVINFALGNSSTNEEEQLLTRFSTRSRI